MAITITIQGTPIQFPSASASPDWSPAVIAFALAVEAALNGLAGSFDVPPQSFDISTLNPGTPNTDIPNLSFSTAVVRAAFIRYTVFRTADSPSTTAYEEGTIMVVYNTTTGTWELNKDCIGDGKVEFNITNSGQMQITDLQIGTVNHVGKITYTAQALSQ